MVNLKDKQPIKYLSIYSELIYQQKELKTSQQTKIHSFRESQRKNLN
jgi:hypothetical protein